MSLIDDALRRVQDPLTPKEPPVAPAPPPATEAPAAHSWTLETTPAAEKKIKQSQWPQLAGALAVFALIGWTASLFLTRQAVAPRLKRRESTTQTIASPVVKPVERASSPASSPASTAGPSLTGVVIGVGEPYAVIDNRIVAKGDLVGNATVKEITETAVTLETPDGGQSVLRVPR